MNRQLQGHCFQSSIPLPPINELLSHMVYVNLLLLLSFFSHSYIQTFNWTQISEKNIPFIQNFYPPSLNLNQLIFFNLRCKGLLDIKENENILVMRMDNKRIVFWKKYLNYFVWGLLIKLWLLLFFLYMYGCIALF